MFFGADIFPFAGEVIYFGEFDLRIPDNLFELGIPFFFGIRSPTDREENGDLNFYYELFFNYDHNVGLYFNSFKKSAEFFKECLDWRNSFFENCLGNVFNLRKLLQSFNGALIFFGAFTKRITYNSSTSSGFERDFRKRFDFFRSFASREFDSFSSAIFLSGEPILLRVFSRDFFGNSVYSRLFSRFLDKQFFFEHFFARNFEIPFNLSRVNQIVTAELTDSFRYFLFDRERIPRLIDTDRKFEKITLGSECNIAKKKPENIFSVAADLGACEIIDGLPQKGQNKNTSSSGLQRRIEALEEKILREKTNSVIDYDSVVQRLDFELRMALNSCGEGVHF